MKRTLPLVAVVAAASQASAQAPATDWWRGTVCYEVFVRSFQDSDGDGVGDLAGLTSRLDHINDGDPAGGEDLGAGCIWLMPVAESPGYHGYDVTDYYRVEPDYGTDADFRRLMAEARRRGIRVIVDLVLNHTSADHPHFQAARSDPASPYRDWYRWLPQHPGVKNPWGGDNWHRSPVRDEYYYAFFWQGMPDLDYTEPAVREEAKRIADFWLGEMGADGFRLDAVSFLVEEGHARVQHAPGTHAVLREFGGHVRARWPRAFTIGEVWDSTATLRAYYPDQLDSYFAFEVSDSLLASVRTGAAAPLMAAVARAEGDLPRGRWAPFLRNHDQERTASALGGDPARARLAATVLLTLPGTPFLYYGEEIGMTGVKTGPDGDMGVRTPMQWTADAGAGFTAGAPWYPLRPDWPQTNVASQRADSASLLAHYRRLVHLRQRTPALGSGDWVPLETNDARVAAYLRRHPAGSVLVLVNLATSAADGVEVTSPAGVLPASAHRPAEVLAGAVPAALRVHGDGAIRAWRPLPRLAPQTGYVITLH